MAPQIHPNLRKQRGQELAQIKDSVKRLNDINYQVKSATTRNEVYNRSLA